MLLAVIPFSKLILTVLVKLVVPNKPEGNKWSTAMFGMGMMISAVSRARIFGGKPSVSAGRYGLGRNRTGLPGGGTYGYTGGIAGGAGAGGSGKPANAAGAAGSGKDVPGGAGK